MNFKEWDLEITEPQVIIPETLGIEATKVIRNLQQGIYIHGDSDCLFPTHVQ